MSLSLQTNLIWGKRQQDVRVLPGCRSTVKEDAVDNMAGLYRRDQKVPLCSDKTEMMLRKRSDIRIPGGTC